MLPNITVSPKPQSSACWETHSVRSWFTRVLTSQGRPEWFDLGNRGPVLEDTEVVLSVTTLWASLCLPGSLHRMLGRAAVSRENMLSLCLQMHVYSWAEVWVLPRWPPAMPPLIFLRKLSLFSWRDSAVPYARLLTEWAPFGRTLPKGKLRGILHYRNWGELE